MKVQSPIPPGALAIGAIIVLPLLVLGSSVETGVVAVLGPPSRGLEGAIRAVVEADGAIVGVAGGPILIASSARSGFVGRLYAAGAWLVLPSPTLSCTGRLSDAGSGTLAPTISTRETARP